MVDGQSWKLAGFPPTLSIKQETTLKAEMEDRCEKLEVCRKRRKYKTIVYIHRRLSGLEKHGVKAGL